MDNSVAKGLSPTTDFRTTIELANAYAVSEKHSTHSNEMDMDCMGKLQVLRVSPNMPLLSLQRTHDIISANSSSCLSLVSL
jgi:hypothetical protein